MNKYLAVKVVVMIIFLVGILWLMQSLKTEPHFEEFNPPSIPAKVITQPPKATDPASEH
jgi:uncharacterized membrane protein YwzB